MPPPFPRAAVAIAVLPILTDGLSESVIFSFLPYMIADFGYDDVGYYSGLLGSIRSVTLLFSAVCWGRLSDKVGRKPPLLFGLAVAFVTQIGFGLSTTLLQALVCRALMGLLSSNVTVAKALLRDLVPPEHRALAFSFMGVAYGSGFLVGGILGGVLTGVASSGGDEASVWALYPYLLPCLASVAAVPVGMIGLCCLGETVGPRAAHGSDLRQVKHQDGSGRMRAACAWAASSPIALLIWAMSVMSFVFMSLAEVFPLFISSDLHGLGMQPSELGLALSPTGISILLVPLVGPPLIKRLGATRAFQLSVLVQCFIALAMPSLKLARAASLPALWASLVVMSLLRGLGGSLGFITTAVMLNEMITERAGYYNGLADSATAAFKAVAPFAAGALFAATTHEPAASFPWDEHLTFYCVGALCLLALALSRGFGGAGGVGGTSTRRTAAIAAVKQQPAERAEQEQRDEVVHVEEETEVEKSSSSRQQGGGAGAVADAP